jgi:hypothetical protein
MRNSVNRKADAVRGEVRVEDERVGTTVLRRETASRSSARSW